MKMAAADPQLERTLASKAATAAFGEALGQGLQPNDVLGLDGPLGAGKTTLVQAIARGLAVPGKQTVHSPSFTLINEYPGRLTLYHVDLYRLKSAAELQELGLWEICESGGVTAVEWLSRFPETMPADRLQIDLSPGRRRSERRVVVRAQGPRAMERLAALREALQP